MIDSFARTTEDIVCLDEFRALLESGRKLRIKFGADVTAPFLHLGHAVNLWMMREMQERGHLVQFLIGDFTTKVGDPTGRSGSRVPPSSAEIERDAAAFIRQVGRVLITDDPEVFEVRRNSEWWDGATLGEFLAFAGGVTASRLLSRDMFRARAEAGAEVRIDEMLYPLLQGWDSVMLRSDLTIVGSDQLFNESMGRMFQEKAAQRPQVIVTTRITPGLDGKRKQSKTLGNFIAIDDDPRTMFGKAMSLPDGLIRSWLEVYTTMRNDRIEELCGISPPESGIAGGPAGGPEGGPDPRRSKVELARELVERWHGAQAACAEAAWFESAFSRGLFPADAQEARVPAGVHRAIDLIARVAPDLARAEIRRLLAAGAIEADGRRLARADEPLELRPSLPLELRLGKRRFLRVTAQEAPG
ncbi:MAG: tyrosine--tRNA ligase [Spirochaetaceae bacterium]|nr:tyrosine--tRNA ligase [Spirochaetaceae bacterium]